MFAYIKGVFEEKGNNYVVIDVGGIGYKIFMSNIAIAALGETGNIVKVHTYYYVREDNISLYGFATKEELKMFELLISVSGVGAKSAISMLSAISPSDFAMAIISDDVTSLKKVPGIGAKTAQRIILELKDKLKNDEIAETSNDEVTTFVSKSETTDEAVAALQILGYTKKDIEKVLSGIDLVGKTTQDIIKIGLKYLSNN
ncbi:MAG: Holliday junction branch migration protein RuvA [Clostridia bacterium]|nr:Holliday junction branch migration protein RuvA [Clostridia bacterium]